MSDGRYELIDVLGAGDTGEVWRGRDRTTDRLVAIKVVHPDLAADPRLVDRFLRAKQVLTGVWHPEIARLLDVVFEDGELRLVTDLIPGVDLRRHLPVSPRQALHICASLAGALAAAHRVGVVHGDLKPSNVVIPDDGEPAVLTDFSVALLARSHARASEYHPPDEIAGAVPGPAGDVYALGMLLQDMVARPDGELSSVALSSTVAECLRLDPAARPDAQHLQDHLLALMHDTTPPPPAPPAPTPPPAPPPPPPPRAHHRAEQPTRRGGSRIGMFVAIGLTALVLVAVGIALLTKTGSLPQAGAPPPASSEAPPALPAPATTWTQPGGAAFVGYWFATLNYATRTGDTSTLTAATNAACGGCRPALDVITNGYANGGSLSGGSYLVREVRTSALWTNDRPVYDVTVDRAPRSGLDRSGVTTQTVAGAPFANCTLILEWVDGTWRVLEIPTSDCIA
jgi:serine/threonine-protein kinase